MGVRTDIARDVDKGVIIIFFNRIVIPLGLERI